MESFQLGDNLLDNDKALSLLTRKKHTRLEGMVMEYEFSQVYLERLKDLGWQVFDSLFLNRYLASNNHSEFLILKRDSDEQLQPILRTLEEGSIPVRILKIEDDSLYFCHDRDGKPLDSPKELEPKPPKKTDKEYVNVPRIKAMYWGFSSHLEKLFERYLKDLVIKDFYLDARSDALWDLDHFAISPEGDIHHFETKHKFPFPEDSGEFFGMNTGEYITLEQLSDLGIQVHHTLLSKPYWDKNVSSMYLFFDREARERALWLNAEFENLEPLSESEAAAETSLHGSSGTRYKTFRVDDFTLIGSNDLRKDELADRYEKIINGKINCETVNSELLFESKIN